MTLSIIVPVRDEARMLPALLAQLVPLLRAGCEVLWVDGGSADGSAAMIERAGFDVVHAPAGRARQMNARAARRVLGAGESVLLVGTDCPQLDATLHDIDAAPDLPWLPPALQRVP
ncbi:MAG: glycosyltransferase [Rhodoferax sp.]|jgi:glycosyltransferase A (GT-A) superfamily protein (DUF2064 family)|uniref:glycosyltransferase n=1 Tax=Rhodoferax sp. TaxID=50421 RepID=UPI003BB168DD